MKKDRVNNQQTYFIYKVLIFFLVLSYNFWFVTPTEADNLKIFSEHCYYILLIISFLVFMLFTLTNIFKVTKKDLIVISEISLFIIYGLLGRDTLLLEVLSFSILCIVISRDDLINIVGLAAVITFFGFLVLAILKMVPMYRYTGFDPVRQKDNMLTLGFIHKNSAGYFMFMTILEIIFLNKKKLCINYFVIGLGIYISWFVIDDRTVAMILILLLSLLLLKKKFLNLHVLVKFLISILPLFLCAFSIWLSLKYDGSGWINRLSQFLSGRIAIWNYDWRNYSLSLLPQNLSEGNMYSIDGFYALGIFINGIIGFICLLLLLSYLLKYMIKNINTNNTKILIFSICLIVFGFSEQIPILSLNWLLPLTFLVQSGEINKNGTK